MSGRNVTLLAVHFHSHGDVQVGPRRTGGGGTRQEESADRGRPALALPALAVGTLALLALAGLARRLLRAR